MDEETGAWAKWSFYSNIKNENFVICKKADGNGGHTVQSHKESPVFLHMWNMGEKDMNITWEMEGGWGQKTEQWHGVCSKDMCTYGAATRNTSFYTTDIFL